MKRKIGTKTYGSALGDFLRSRCSDIGRAEAGEGGDAGAKGSAVAEELAGACGMAADEFAHVLAGDVDPTPEQADAMAAVLTKHGVECTGADLLAIDQKEPESEEKTDDEKAAEDKAAESKEKALRAAQSEATEFRGKHEAVSVELGTLREQHAALVAQVAKVAPLVKLGQASLEAKRRDVIKRAELGGGNVTQTFRDTVAGASSEQLEALSAAFGLDPVLDPMCSDCQQKRAGRTYRSSEPPQAGEQPKGLAPPRSPTRDDIADAARAYQREQESAGDRIAYSAAEAAVRRMTHEQIHALAAKA